tara:strand:- start:882 stop:1304 length:423 start_codon:yes stop_codon:yes gene_type:complete
MTNNAAYAGLILRLALGVMFISHGLMKVLVFTIPGTVGFFESIGYPGWLAYLVILGEVGGGALLILGIYTRQIALANTLILLGSIPVHWGSGWMFSNEGGGWEYPVFLVVVSVAVALIGDGAYALRLPWGTEKRAPGSAP